MPPKIIGRKLLERAGVIPASQPVVAESVPERAGREGDQPVPVVGQASVFAEVRRRLDEREAIGIRRYGRSLETFNGRDAGLDLEDELLDGLNYATQLRLERSALAEAVKVLARYHRTGQTSPAFLAALALADQLEKTSP
jgi:hypothetical protein